MRIGVYVGSFNPVHLVHLKIANLFLENNLLDHVIFVPAGDEYEKQGLASGKHRLEMLLLATSSEPRFSVSDIEVKHRKLSTFKTLELLNEEWKNDELYLIMGTDNLKEFYWWDYSDELVEKYKIYVLTRGGLHEEDFPEYRENKNVIFINFDTDMSATSVRKDLEEKRFENAKTKIHLDVFDYILKNQLYGSTVEGEK